MSLTASGSLEASLFSTDAARWQAIVARDRTADGAFVYAVRTTGVYCRPGCPARTPNRGNVRFFADCEAAERAGFRACRRCRPRGAGIDSQHASIVARACRHLEQAGPAPALSELARRAGLSPSRFHRVFKNATGITPRAYAAAVRAEHTRTMLRAGRTVTEAMHAGSFGSSSRFYEAAVNRLGMTPTEFRAGGAGTQITFAVGECWIGSILVAATLRGLCAILLGDAPDALVRDLQDRFPRAELIGGDRHFERTVATVVGFVQQPRRGLDLPLDIQGTAFQQRVWDALRRIPAGAQATYTDIARRIGRPDAVRGVAAACAANPLAVAIPCHRVVRRDGSLAGYRWGIERKQALLELEQSSTPPGVPGLQKRRRLGR